MCGLAGQNGISSSKSSGILFCPTGGAAENPAEPAADLVATAGLVDSHAALVRAAEARIAVAGTLAAGSSVAAAAGLAG